MSLSSQLKKNIKNKNIFKKYRNYKKHNYIYQIINNKHIKYIHNNSKAFKEKIQSLKYVK